VGSNFVAVNSLNGHRPVVAAMLEFEKLSRFLETLDL
jgi:hypothetical protein